MKTDALAGQREPAGQGFILLEHFRRQAVGAVNILGIAGEGHPAERATALAKQRADILRDEPGDIERVFDAGLLCLGADVVAVVEGHRAQFPERQHGFHMRRHRGHGTGDVLLRVPLAQGMGLDGVRALVGGEPR